ncbi:MAG: signal peptidase II [Elusimicrobia bacterium RIFOXYD2_FULL_34_30]|nr:MAG: signal peptidase II [Elusimicrobia bacterium RIFOXYD2_FULL_34_30]
MFKMRKEPLIIIILVVILDQLTKYLVVKNFYYEESIPIINKIFYLTYITNTGTAFGKLQNYGGILLVFSIIAITILSLIIFKQKNIPKINMIAFSFILGGAIGNVIDRIFRGSIVDFLDFRIWPIFNVADSAISIGIILLIYHTMFSKQNH